MRKPTPEHLSEICYEADLGGTAEVNGTIRFAWINNRQLHYRLEVHHLPRVTGSRLRLGGPGGSIVTFIYGPTNGGTASNSLDAQGYVYRENLAGRLHGKPLSALVQEMNRGNVWVDVTTVKKPHGAVDGQVYKRA